MILKPRLFRKPPHGHPLGPDGGLVGCWLMNEGTGGKVLDLSGNKNTGTLVADTHWVPANFGPGLNFDGTGDYVEVADADSLSLINGFTISAWVKRDSGTATGYIVGKYKSAGSHWEYAFIFSTVKLYCYLYDVSASAYIGRYGAHTSTEWVHVLVTYDGGTSSSGIKIYNNAIQIDTDNFQNGTFVAMENRSSPVQIGAGGDGSNPFSGLIDHVLIYNRALSAAEIGQLYMFPFCMFEDDPIELWTAASGAAVGISMPLVMQQMNHFNGGGMVA